MNDRESLSDKAVSALALLEEVKRVLEGINDYGEATGFCDDQEQLVNDAHAMLGSLRCRASRLKQRIKRHFEAEAKRLPWYLSLPDDSQKS